MSKHKPKPNADVMMKLQQPNLAKISLKLSIHDFYKQLVQQCSGQDRQDPP